MKKKNPLSFFPHLATSINPVFLYSNVAPIFRKPSTGDNTQLMVTINNTNKFFKGCLAQILLGPFLNAFSRMSYLKYFK